MLGGPKGPCVANVACGRDPHHLKPSSSQEALVEGKPNQGTHLPRMGVVSDPVNHLKSGGVVEAEIIDECDDSRGVRGPLTFMYPLLAVFPKKGTSPSGYVSFQCHSPRS